MQIRFWKLDFGFITVRLHWPKPREVKQCWQKLTRGFSDDEVYNLDSTITKFVLPRLERWMEFKRHPPYGLTDKEWYKIQFEIVYAFKEMNREDWSFEKTYRDENNVEQKETQRNYRRRMKRIDQGLSLFAKYFSFLSW